MNQHHQDNNNENEENIKTLEKNNTPTVEEGSNTQDTLLISKEARANFVKATTRPMREKMEDFRGFMQLLNKSQHQRVANIFLITTAAMFTLPIIILLIGMYIIAPWLELDAGLCGGLLALTCTICIMTAYTIYALLETNNNNNNTSRRSGTTTEEEKKKN